MSKYHSTVYAGEQLNSRSDSTKTLGQIFFVLFYVIHVFGHVPSYFTIVQGHHRPVLATVMYIAAFVGCVCYFQLYKLCPGYLRKGANIDTEPWKINGHPADPRGKCETCLIDRPQRSKHCKDCDQCVAMFDHHCLLLGRCVGEGNQRMFLLFITAEMVHLSAFVFLLVETIFNHHGETGVRHLIEMVFFPSKRDPLHPSVMPVILLPFLSLVLLYISLTLLDQVVSISQGLTVNELHNHSRYEYLRLCNPHNQGFVRNWGVFVSNGRNCNVLKAKKCN